MLLALLLIIPFFSGIFSFFSHKIKKDVPRWVALIGAVITLLIILKICFFKGNCNYQIKNYPNNWDYQLIFPWIPSFGISFHIGIDGFSEIMLFLAVFLGIIAILSSWNEIKKNEGFFYLNIMLVLSGIIGIFMSLDLFLFFFFWEVILVPMYFLITLWHQEDKKILNSIHTVANKFFIYSQISGLLILISILLLVLNYYKNTNILTFNYDVLLFSSIDPTIEYISMFCFFVAFIIKMPIIPFHSWLVDFHSRSTYCGAVDIIGVLLKIAPYGFVRYSLVFFPNFIEKFSFIAMFLGIFSLFYGAWSAFSQNNIKRFIAYSSISHMGLILIAMCSNSEIALQGVVIQMLSNSISTAALCVLSGHIYKNLKTQDMRKIGGLWKSIYWLPGFSVFFILSNLGLPGTGNFVGEFLIFFGIFKEHPIVSIISITSIVFVSVYSIYMMQKVCFGQQKKIISIFFLNIREFFIFVVLIIFVIFLGLIPQKILEPSWKVIHAIHSFKK